MRGALGVLGDLVEDVVVWLDEPVKRATDTPARIHRTRGGSAANVAAFAAREHPARFLGCVGADPTGDALIAELAGHGVDVRVQRSGRTGTVVILVDRDGERSMLPDRGAAAQYADTAQDTTDGLAHLHVPGYAFAEEPCAGTARTLLAAVRARGGTTSVDASSTGMLRHYGPRRFLDLLESLRPNLILANQDEAAELGPRLFGIATTVVKHGAEPTVVHRQGHPPVGILVPPVTGVRDLTGAGDAFAAGLLTALLAGAPFTAACERGHAFAATVLTEPGARAR